MLSKMEIHSFVYLFTHFENKEEREKIVGTIVEQSKLHEIVEIGRRIQLYSGVYASEFVEILAKNHCD